MAWVNIFDNEDCLIGYATRAPGRGSGVLVDPYEYQWAFPNSYYTMNSAASASFTEAGTMYLIEKGRSTQFFIPMTGHDEDLAGTVSAYYDPGEDYGAKVIQYGGMYAYSPEVDSIQISPSGGISGRRFRVRVVNLYRHRAYVSSIDSRNVEFSASLAYPGEYEPPRRAVANYADTGAVAILNAPAVEVVYTTDWHEFPVVDDMFSPAGLRPLYPAALTGDGWLNAQTYMYANEGDNLERAETWTAVEWQVWIDDVPETTVPFVPTNPSKVYELEKGWSFDGNYIPHFLELNWYWGDNPVDFTGLQKIRIHGLTKGFTNMTVAVNSMETDEMDYRQWYTEPQIIDLPRNKYYVNSEFESATSTADVAGRGLSIQMKFEGRNTEVARPEPSHVVQVLVLQSTPAGTGQRSY